MIVQYSQISCLKLTLNGKDNLLHKNVIFCMFFFPLQSAEFSAKQRKLQYLEHPAFARQTQQVNIFEHVNMLNYCGGGAKKIRRDLVKQLSDQYHPYTLRKSIFGCF